MSESLGLSHRTVVTAVSAALVVMAGQMFLSWLFTSSPDAITLVANVPIPDDMKEHTKIFERPEVIQAADGIYVATGYALANSILIEAPDGAIIVDTTESIESATNVVAAFRHVTKKPVKAIIYTHNHIDHMGGTKAFLEDLESPPEIWAHHLIYSQLDNVNMVSASHMVRGIRQFGPMLPKGAHVNSGIGKDLKITLDQGTMSSVLPTKLPKKKKVPTATLR